MIPKGEFDRSSKRPSDQPETIADPILDRDHGGFKARGLEAVQDINTNALHAQSSV